MVNEILVVVVSEMMPVVVRPVVTNVVTGIVVIVVMVVVVIVGIGVVGIVGTVGIGILVLILVWFVVPETFAMVEDELGEGVLVLNMANLLLIELVSSDSQMVKLAEVVVGLVLRFEGDQKNTQSGSIEIVSPFDFGDSSTLRLLVVSNPLVQDE